MNSTIILLKKKKKQQQNPSTVVWCQFFIIQGTEAIPKTNVQVPYKKSEENLGGFLRLLIAYTWKHLFIFSCTLF